MAKTEVFGTNVQIAQTEDIDVIIQKIKETSLMCTPVVGWWPHIGEVRGPFNRWLKITEIEPQYQKHCGERADDAKYASACMNFAPRLVQEVERLREILEHPTSERMGHLIRERNELKAQVQHLSHELGIIQDKYSKAWQELCNRDDKEEERGRVR